MGRLVEFPIKTLFNGVSRQPDPVRLPGQVEDAENVVFSVETGGFTKRYGSRHIARLLGYGAQSQVNVHVIDRDQNERYVLVKDGVGLRVFDINGVEKTVNPYDATVGAYLASSTADFTFVTVADHTFILNRGKMARMDPAVTAPAQENLAVIQVAGARPGEYSLTVDGKTVSWTATDSSADWSTVKIARNLADLLDKAWNLTEVPPPPPEPTMPDGDPLGTTPTEPAPTEPTYVRNNVFLIERHGSYIHLRRVGGGAFSVKSDDPAGDRDILVTHGTVKNSGDLPAQAPDGMIVRVGGDPGGGEYWVKFKAVGSSRGVWNETLAPGSLMRFDASTMPHLLVREANGTFTVKQATWNDKMAGDLNTVPNPDFVDRTISDVVFHRNRLALVADESIVFSQAGDYFNFWPERATEVIDSDPFGMTASTNKVSILRYATPFRKSLFATADNAQFEVSGQTLTPKSAVIDLATSYTVSRTCRPFAMGDTLYMAADNGKDAVLLEYLYSESSLSNVAVDVTKHVRGYVPAPLLSLTGDPVTGTIFALSQTERDRIYTYTVFWNGDERAQSAWGHWRLPGAKIHSIAFLSGYLVAVVERPDGFCLEKITVGLQGYNSYEIVPRLDREVRATGVYDSVTGTTKWSLPYADPTVKAYTSNTFADPSKRGRDIALKVEGNDVTARGEWAGGEVMFGIEYPSFVELSKQFAKENDASILNGRLQLRTITFSYQHTGWFEVEVTPQAREVHTSRFTGRIIGSVLNVIGKFTLESGTFRVRVGSRGDTVRIRVVNNTFLPHTITSAACVGFFNETSRQG